MAQTFEGAQPQVVRGKQKNPYRPMGNAYDEEEPSARETLNIMHDKRVFRGNTHGINNLKTNEKNFTAAEKDEQRITADRENKKIEMIKN
jgi:hypothetical protein